MPGLIETHLKGHFAIPMLLALSLLVFGPVLFGFMALLDYLTSTRDLAILVFPVGALSLLCLYWMLWFPVKASHYFLTGERTLLQSIHAACLDWWLCFRRLPLVRGLSRKPSAPRHQKR